MPFMPVGWMMAALEVFAKTAGWCSGEVAHTDAIRICIQHAN
jgi:hypothetical protein